MFRKLLVAVDRSPSSGRALKAASDLAKLSGGSAVVVHVLEQGGGKAGAYDAEPPVEAQEIVDVAVETLRKEGVQAEGTLERALVGHVARTLDQAAHRVAADVIVIGSRGLGDMSALLLGSTTHKLLHLTEIPVLVVR